MNYTKRRHHIRNKPIYQLNKVLSLVKSQIQMMSAWTQESRINEDLTIV